MEKAIRFTMLYFDCLLLHYTNTLTWCIDNCISRKPVLLKFVDYLQVFKNSQVS